MEKHLADMRLASLVVSSDSRHPKSVLAPIVV
jgi:hypothetical protein